MSIRNLDSVLHPRNIVLVGGSTRAGSVGQVVLSNVVGGGFQGQIFAVNPHKVVADEVRWHQTIASLPIAPDLAIVMTPPATVPDCIDELGKLGTRSVVIVSAGIDEASGLKPRMLAAAAAHGTRIIGPNCLGLLMPHARLNASFAHVGAKPGRLAFISQSGALITAMLDWAAPRGIGFSGILSVGDMADADIADFIDLFATDPNTDAILLYVEGLSEAAKYMSAASAAARLKPLIAIKAGRGEEAQQAARSHSGAMAGSYPVYSAAFERAGIIQVESLTDLFDAAELLCKCPPAAAAHVAVISNGGGAAVLAIDHLKQQGIQLAELAPSTIETLDGALPANWSRANPVDIIGDADDERYRAAIRAVLADPGVDALLVLHCPTALASSTAVALALASEAGSGKNSKPVLACWLGDGNADLARPALDRANIPLFQAPEDAARAFGYLRAAEQSRAALTERIAPARAVGVDRAAAAKLIAAARKSGRTLLNEIETKALLDAYGVPTVTTRLARKPVDVVDACIGLRAPYAVKVVSPDIVHKSDVGGVALRLSDPSVASGAALTMDERIRRQHPQAKIDGYAVQSMCVRPHAIELLAGVAHDPTFGPVLLFGAGGKAVEAIGDRMIALPPIDREQARAMISRTRVARLLEGYRDERAADLEAIAEVLVALSDLVSDFPDIVELDLNPVLADADGVIVVDARAVVTEQPVTASRMAIRPVPRQWAADLKTRSGIIIHARPTVPADEAALAEFFGHVTPDDLRFRFLSGLSRVSHEQLNRMTQIDYRRSISFIATEPSGAIVATALLVADPDRTRAEIAMSTRADWKGRGVSYALLEHLLRYAQAEGIKTLEAVEFADHHEALRMEREMGFTALACPDDPSLRIVRRQFAA
jgi:acetyltransferase